MSSKKYDLQVFLDLYYLRKMVCGERVGTVCGRTKKYIVLGLTDDSGVTYSAIQFIEENLNSGLYKSYCFVNPDESLLIENWVRKQHRDTRNLRIGFIVIVIIQLFNLYILIK